MKINLIYKKKCFGQHFITNEYYINKIIDYLQLNYYDKLIEIGPGLGALTKHLLIKLKKLVAIEIDIRFKNYLFNLLNSYKLYLIINNALKFNYSQFGKNLRIVGNLPYNISTALLIYFMKYIDYIFDIHVMLQQEVALRLISKPGSKLYGRFSIMIQYFCNIQYLFNVPSNAFYPKPKVSSAMVRIIPYKTKLYPIVNNINFFNRILLYSFSHRRKTLKNNLKNNLDLNKIKKLGIDLSLRPEQLTIRDYVKIANLYQII